MDGAHKGEREGGALKRRRLCIRLTVLVALVSLGIYPFLETRWLRTVHLKLGRSPAPLRIVHISDIHYKGDRGYFQRVVRRVNELQPDFVCFTGDLVEDPSFQEEALRIFAEVKAPIFAVPGNHDHWHSDLLATGAAMRRTGGELLINEWRVWQQGNRRAAVVGIDDMVVGAPQPERIFPPTDLLENGKLIVLTHAPAILDRLGGRKFDLAIAGHSHGGQVMLPPFGGLAMPPGVGRYQKGLYDTEGGPLYVNPGIGTFWLPVRLFCRPEVTCIEL